MMSLSEQELLQEINTPLPAYYRLQEALRRKIEDGLWKPGEAIPSERLIAEEYRISIGTVKKAVGNLAGEGYLHRVQGKGTFVGGSTLKRGSLRYYRMVREFNDEVADLEVKLLGIREVPGFDPANRYLGIPGSARLFELTRLFLSGGAPVVYSISYLPKKLFKDLDRMPAGRLEKSTLYETIEQNYGLPTIRNHELYGAAPADARTAGLLKIAEGEPLLTIEMLSFTYKSVPYEYRRSYCVTSGYKIFTEI
ncbi:MAG: GntR family transcriptional regulator [Spirochaetes bacterium]|nr:MAG: GntR family transcriptional regulator [Spirochaetota bacterium]